MTKLNKLAAVFLAAAFAFAGALPAGAVTVADTPVPDRIYYRETAGEAFSGEFAMDREITKVEAGEDPAFTLSFEGSALIFDGLTHSVEQAVRIVCGEEALDKTLKLAVYDLVDIAPAKSSLILTVKNSRTLQPVPNVGYTLYRGTQAVRRGLVTDRQGQLTASGLEPGDYLLRPSSTPGGYKAAPGVKFTVTGLEISGGEKEIRTSDGKKNIAGENEVLIAGKFSPDIVLTAGQDKQIGSVTVEYEDFGEAKSLEYSALHAAQEELNRRKNSGEILGPVHITYEYAEKSGRSYTQYLTEKEPEPTPPVNQGNTVTKPTPTAAPTPKATSTAAPTAAPKPTVVPTPAPVPDGQLTIACTADKPGQAFSFEVSGTKLEGGKFRQDYKTDTDGKIAASLPAGKYTVTPKSAKGFDLPEPQTIELIGGGSAYLTFSFVANQRDLALTVVDDDGQPVPGVTVGLFEHGETPLPKVKKNTESSADISAALVQIKEQKAADEKLADPYTKANALYVGKTGEDGTALIQNVPVSGFAAVPIELPDGYSAEKIATEITAGLEDKFTVDCKYVAVDISVWSSNTNSPVVGAELTLMDRDGEKLTEWISEEAAHRLIRVPKGEYRLVICQAKQNDTVAFEVGGDESVQEIRAETYLPGAVDENAQRNIERRLISVMLAAILILAVFAACGGTEKNSSKAPESSSSAPSSSEAQSSTTESSLESSDDGEPSGNEPMNLVVAYPLINGVPQDNKLIEAEINEITQEKLNDTIELMPISMGNYQQQMQLMLASEEKLDCFVIRSNSFNAYYSANQMTDLSDLIHEYGQGIIDAVGQSFIDAGKLDGKLYGITTNRDLAVGHGGLVVRQDYMEEAGYKKEDIKTIDDLDGLFAKVHENHPDVQVITSNSGSSIYGTLGMSFDPLTDGFAVLRNFGLDDLTVVNAFATNEYKDYCLHARKWYEAGYISADIAAVTEGGPSQVKAGRAFAYNNRYKPGADNQESKMCGTPVVTLTVLGDATYTSIPQSFMWGIPYSAESPERSMEYLNEQYTNPEIMNLLAWGIEGTHYDITEDGHITAAAALNGAESGYNPSAGWIFGNQFITHVWEGDELDLYKNLKAFNDGADKSKAFGFTFNSDSVLTEIAAVQGVYDQYKIGLESGLVDTETTLDQMLSEMESAGIQKIIDEKQRQLDEWAAANGVS